MSAASRFLLLATISVLLPLAALAADVRVQLGAGDDFVVKDSGSAELVRVEESTGDLTLSSPGGQIQCEGCNSFRVARSGNQSISSGITTTVVFNSFQGFARGTSFSDYDTSTGRYTVPSTGVYHFSAVVTFGSWSGSASSNARATWYKNGSPEVIIGFIAGNTGTSFVTLGGSITLELNIGDFVEVRVLQNTGSTRNLVSDRWTQLSAFRVH